MTSSTFQTRKCKITQIEHVVLASIIHLKTRSIATVYQRRHLHQ